MSSHPGKGLHPFMRSVVDRIEDRDHRVVILERGEYITDAVAEWMEADGYKFAAAPAADETGRRRVYFACECAPTLQT